MGSVKLFLNIICRTYYTTNSNGMYHFQLGRLWDYDK